MMGVIPKLPNVIFTVGPPHKTARKKIKNSQ